MEKLKKLLQAGLLLFFLMSLILPAAAQGGVHKNMVLVEGTFGLGATYQEWKYYVQGDLGFMASDIIEINGAIYANVGSSKQEIIGIYEHPNIKDLDQVDFYTHSLFFGPRFHFLPKQEFDVFAAFQPGISLVNVPQITISDFLGSHEVEPRHWGVAPNLSLEGGIAYYGSFFHLYYEARFIAGNYQNQAYNVPLTEFRQAFGLGFNFN